MSIQDEIEYNCSLYILDYMEQITEMPPEDIHDYAKRVIARHKKRIAKFGPPKEKEKS